MTRALWIPWAVRRPGPPEKPDGVRPRTTGIVLHSTGGGSLSGALGELDKPNSENPSNWHGTIDYDGTLHQHYSLDLHCDHAGDHEFHDSTIAFEFVGWHGGFDWRGNPNPWEPWTTGQFLTAVRLLRFLGPEEAWVEPLSRADPQTCFRHSEIVATACDGDRAPWDRLLAVVNAPPPTPPQEDDMQRIIRIRDGQGRILNYYVNGGVRKRCANEETADKLLYLGVELVPFPGSAAWRLYTAATHESEPINLANWP